MAGRKQNNKGEKTILQKKKNLTSLKSSATASKSATRKHIGTYEIFSKVTGEGCSRWRHAVVSKHLSIVSRALIRVNDFIGVTVVQKREKTVGLDKEREREITIYRFKPNIHTQCREHVESDSDGARTLNEIIKRELKVSVEAVSKHHRDK